MKSLMLVLVIDSRLIVPQVGSLPSTVVALAFRQPGYNFIFVHIGSHLWVSGLNAIC